MASNGPAAPGWVPSRLRRLRTPLLVVIVALALGQLGFAWGLRQERSSTATAVILLNPVEGNPFAPDGTAGADLVDLETEAQLVVSHDVARLVAERRGHRRRTTS